MMKTSQSDFCLSLRGMLLVLLAVVLSTGGVASAQALPAAEAAPISTGFALPTTLGSLQYAVSASQSLVWGFYSNSGASASTNLSGDLAYLSNSKQHPFSAVLSGGRSWSESGQSSYSFASLGVSQVANFGRWNFVISDSVSYLPGTPVAGLSGVPGVGDLGITPVQIGTDTGQGILTNYSNRITNSAAGTLSRQLTGKTSINASGTYSIYRFLDSPTTSTSISGAGLDSDSVSGGGGLTHQLNARSSYGANYSYSSFTYPNNTFGVFAPDFNSQTASAFVSHQFTRRLGGSISAGPQWTTISTSGSSPAVSLFVSASSSYSAKNYLTTLSFTRSTNSGFGAVGGAISNSANLSVNRTFAMVWNAAATVSYARTSNLPGPNVPVYSSSTYVVGAQVSRAIARSLSCYASYTLEDQSVSATSTVDVFSGMSQVVGFGITFSPSALHLGRQ
jgi:hypothetical protein